MEPRVNSLIGFMAPPTLERREFGEPNGHGRLLQSRDCRIMDETLISVCLSSDHHHRCNIAAVESDRKKFIGGDERNSRELIGPLLHDSVCQCLATKMTCRQKDVAY